MGANAQTSVPVFTAGQVLTAQQQSEINTGIPVFASNVTRDAAFGGAGEKTLALGQVCFVEGVGLQFYDGTQWVAAGFTVAYTPVWTCAITPPSLGNGSLTGRFYRFDKFVFFRLQLTAGSTTTFGTGNFEFTTPTAVTAVNNFGYQAAFLDQGTAWFTRGQGLGITTNASDKFICIDSAGTAVQSTVPFTWANTDQLHVQGSYLIA